MRALHENEELMDLFKKIVLSSGPPDMLLSDDEKKRVEKLLEIKDWKAINYIAFYCWAYSVSKKTETV